MGKSGIFADLPKHCEPAEDRSRMKIDCGKTIVRDWQQGDKDSLLYYANNRNIWQNLTHKFPHPYTETNADDWRPHVVSADSLPPTYDGERRGRNSV